MSLIHPTHTCFDDAMDFLAEVAKERPEDLRAARYLVVHAICRKPGTEDRFSHAWVLDTKMDLAIQRGILNGEPIWFCSSRADLEADLRPLEARRYTPREACAENEASGHFGPWEPRYAALCRTGS